MRKSNISTVEHDSAAVPASGLQQTCYIKAPTKLTTNLNSLDYNMNHEERGICLIIDIDRFESNTNLPQRLGSQADSNGLYNLFRSLSFEVRVLKNASAKTIRNELDTLAKADHSRSDCFVCCVLSHGEHGQIWGADGKIAINYLFEPFLGNYCPTLIGKPKLFFIQACQGNKLDHGVLVESLDSTVYFKLPTHADFLVAYSTLPGFYSWRNTQDGSWFMQAFIRVLGTHHNKMDLLSMLTIVNHNVAYYKSSNATSEEFNNKKQVPCITSMLTRRVFLRPKNFLMRCD